ncbi:DUF2989 domain-containing protein [Gallaecimonas mangrovi]|uniref:DUF2989 domain-containing protein n=1 Tax=Gallaecimonas mangrovi TaxID=2291597 RepID=UPI000E20AD65|nr:DUF2989 domain-containing protein [Gallaecimonas mangrovi]
MKRLMWLLAALILSGCNSEPSLQEICQQKPALCSRLNKDGWCRSERAALIRQRYAVSKLTGDPGYPGYKLLLDTEDYRNCMAKAAGVVHKTLKERQSDRGRAYVAILQDLKALQQQYKTSKDPHILYYLYTRLDDQKALDAFLAEEGSGAFNTLELKAMLAGYYAKSDTEKTAQLLLEGLALPRESATVEPDIFQTLATLSMSQRRYQEAYLWTRIAQHHGVATDPKPLEQYLRNDKSLIAKLDKKADEVDLAIKENRFKPPMAQLDPRPEQNKDTQATPAAQNPTPPNSNNNGGQ